MEETESDDVLLLECIPDKELSSEQRAFQRNRRASPFPMYRLLREPTRLDDFVRKTDNNGSCIWRENETIICIGLSAYMQYDERNVCCEIIIENGDDEESRRTFAIYGKTDMAIAETATFFWSLTHLEETPDCLQIKMYESNFGRNFDFAKLKAAQLARILDANPNRCFDFHTGVFTKAQSVVLATRTYRLHLKLAAFPVRRAGLAFKDKGKAFVDALKKRTSSFGALGITGMSFSSANLERLLELEKIFEKLTVRLPEEDFVLPLFSAKVNALDYTIDMEYLEPEDFHSLDIVAKDLQLKIWIGGLRRWREILISFWDRVADLGHFERLSFSIHTSLGFTFATMVTVAESLVRAIRANPKLTCLNLSDNFLGSFNWTPHLQGILQAMEDRSSLRTFIVDIDKHRNLNLFGRRTAIIDFNTGGTFQYSWLERLLSRNRSITVLDGSGNAISNGSSIDKLYLLNRLYHGSTKLAKEESTSLRPSLMATALLENATKNFQHTALLLSSHTDMLCEFMKDAKLENTVSTGPEAAALPDSATPTRQRNDRSKRKRQQ